MIQETTYNENINPMDFAYLRTKLNARILTNGQGFPLQIELPEADDICNCCDPNQNFIQLALASTDDPDSYKNDYASFLYQFAFPSSTLVLTLQKYVGGSWVDQVVLNSTYGTSFPLGIFTDYPTFTGFIMRWRPVLIAFGEGTYRVKIVRTVGIISYTTTVYSPLYCLKEYSVDSANRTIKFEWNDNGFISNSDDDFSITEYGNINWQEMIRLTGNFRYDKDEQEVIETSYYSGNALEVERVRDLTNPKYKFNSGYFPDWIHSILKNRAFKSNSIVVTNYNRLSKHDYLRKAVVKESNGYSPKMDNTYKKWYNVEVDFRDKYDDTGFRKNCQPSGINPEPVTIKDSDGNTITTVPSGGTYVIP